VGRPRPPGGACPPKPRRRRGEGGARAGRGRGERRGRSGPGALRRSHEPAFFASLERRLGLLAGAARLVRRRQRHRGGPCGSWGARRGLWSSGDRAGARTARGVVARARGRFAAPTSRRSSRVSKGALACSRERLAWYGDGNGTGAAPADRGVLVGVSLVEWGSGWRSNGAGRGRSGPGALRRSHEPAFFASLERRLGLLAGAARLVRRRQRHRGGSCGSWGARRGLSGRVGIGLALERRGAWSLGPGGASPLPRAGVLRESRKAPWRARGSGSLGTATATAPGRLLRIVGCSSGSLWSSGDRAGARTARGVVARAHESAFFASLERRRGLLAGAARLVRRRQRHRGGSCGSWGARRGLSGRVGIGLALERRGADVFSCPPATYIGRTAAAPPGECR
jgi:hypothetical protein